MTDGAGRSRLSALGSSVAKALVAMLLFGGLAVALAGGWDALRDYDWQFEPWAVGVAFFVMIAAGIWAALSWLVIARTFALPLGVRPALRIYSTSNLGKYLPGKIWHAFARVYLVQQEGFPLLLATTTVLTDVVLYTAAALLVMLLALPVIVGAVVSVDGPIAMAAAVACLVIGLAFLHPAALNFGLRTAQRIMPSRTFPPIEARYPTILKIFVLYVFLWTLNTAALFAVVHAVNPVPVATFPTVAAIGAFSYLGGLIMPLAPGGMGVREGLMALLLSQVIPLPAAAVVSVLVRVVQLAAEGLCALVFSRL